MEPSQVQCRVDIRQALSWVPQAPLQEAHLVQLRVHPPAEKSLEVCRRACLCWHHVSKTSERAARLVVLVHRQGPGAVDLRSTMSVIIRQIPPHLKVPYPVRLPATAASCAVMVTHFYKNMQLQEAHWQVASLVACLGLSLEIYLDVGLSTLLRVELECLLHTQELHAHRAESVPYLTP